MKKMSRNFVTASGSTLEGVIVAVLEAGRGMPVLDGNIPVAFTSRQNVVPRVIGYSNISPTNDFVFLVETTAFHGHSTAFSSIHRVVWLELGFATADTAMMIFSFKMKRRYRARNNTVYAHGY
jgi:hypothetical protein